MKLKHEQLRPITEQVQRIYEQVKKLERQEGADRKVNLPSPIDLTTSPAILPTRLQSVDDAASGLRYAVWNIGLAVAAIGGADALDQLFALVEELEPDSARLAVWLDHRWNGVPTGNGEWAA